MSWRVLAAADPLAMVGSEALAALRHLGCETVEAGDALNLAGFDAVIAGVQEFDRQTLQSAGAANLKIISRWGVGYDAIDVAAATEQGICIANTPTLLDEAVADYAFALLCALARGVHLGQAALAHGAWTPSWGSDIFGKTLGIVGCGRIGQAVARRGAGFSMRRLAFDPHPKPEVAQTGVEYVPLETLLGESDFVTLHAALTPATRGFIGPAELARMKPTAYLINTARGALVDEPALVRALREGKIAGAALDAFVHEPLPAGHMFYNTPHLLLTPHQASFARETGQRVSRAACAAVADLMQGRRPEWVVNPEVFHSPKLRAHLV